MAKEKKTSLGINFLMNILLRMSSLIFPLITFPYVSRVLAADGYGKIQMATAFVAYFILLSQLGIPTYGIRACAIVRDDRVKLSRTVHELMGIQLLMTVISYGIFFVLLQSIPRLRDEKVLYLITSASIFLGMLGMEWLFQALEQYTYITLRSLAFKVISVIAMFLLVHEKEDYLIYAGISVAASAGSNVMNLTQLRKYVSLKSVGGYDIKRHVKPVLVFFAMVCAATVYTNLDSVMLGFMATDADVGYYSAAVKIKNILVNIVAALGTVLLPRVSYYFEQDKMDEFWAVIQKALSFVVLVALPLSVYFMVFARNGIYFLSGSGYENAVPGMIIIMPTVLLIGLTNIMGIQLLVPTGREKVVMYSTVVGAVVDVIANAILIPSMKAAGAALGTLIAEFAVLVVQYWVLRKEVGPIFKKMKLLPIGLAVAASAAASFWVAGLPFADFYILAISAVIFFGVYVALLHVIKEPAFLEVEGILLRKLGKLLHKR